jgi:2-polyprenyl-3-methyl-5-hydroxy-6-metoxy-1,4-benzoquinol methylase
MATVISHYENILADRYTWLFGGLDSNIAVNKEFFLQNNLTPKGSGVAVDLGAGSGFQSIPLAQLGFAVTAIDLSEKLLQELARNSPGLDIQTVVKDFTSLSDDDISNVELLVCMGDTLTHLNAKKEVQKLLKKIYLILVDLGRAVFWNTNPK